jgi:hypothetical protein
MPSKSIPDGTDSFPSYYYISLLRHCTLLVSIYLLTPVKVSSNPRAVLFPVSLSFPQLIVTYVEDILVDRVLGWRGGKPVIAWILPFLEVQQLSATLRLYPSALRTVGQRQDLFNVDKFQKAWIVILTSSVLSFVWMTGLFCYFHLIRMSRTQLAYEPVYRSLDMSESEPLLSCSGGESSSEIGTSALADAARRQRSRVCNTSIRPVEDNVTYHDVSSANPAHVVIQFVNGSNTVWIFAECECHLGRADVPYSCPYPSSVRITFVNTVPRSSLTIRRDKPCISIFSCPSTCLGRWEDRIPLRNGHAHLVLLRNRYP